MGSNEPSIYMVCKCWMPTFRKTKASFPILGSGEFWMDVWTWNTHCIDGCSGDNHKKGVPSWVLTRSFISSFNCVVPDLAQSIESPSRLISVAGWPKFEPVTFSQQTERVTNQSHIICFIFSTRVIWRRWLVLEDKHTTKNSLVNFLKQGVNMVLWETEFASKGKPRLISYKQDM